ncbi:MAG: hypothetical protein WBW41_12565 [Verrucomicrobiia bacterium]
MAKAKTVETDSPYYPPRARWYSPLFRPWSKLQRALHLERIRFPAGFTAGQVVLSLLLPGYSLFVNRRKTVGAAFAAIYLASLVCFVVWLGFPMGGAAYGLMISIHASSIIFLENCALRDKYEFGIRFPLAIVTLLVVWLAAYRPVVKFAEANWWRPMIVRGQVMVMKPAQLRDLVQPGEWVLYAIGGNPDHYVHGEGAVWVRSGFSLGPVLAVAGDTVRFTTNVFFINGHPAPRLPHMPDTGEVQVPEKHWFIWPNLDISGHGNVGEDRISSAMLQLAMVSENQYVGKPFQRWLWRRQIIP